MTDVRSPVEILTQEELEAFRSFHRKRYRNKALDRKVNDMTDAELAAHRKYDAAYQKARHQRKMNRMRELEEENKALRLRLGNELELG